MSLPPLSPSSSETSLPISEPTTPPKLFSPLRPQIEDKFFDDSNPPIVNTDPSTNPRPEPTRRPSHDLFECIEQSENKHLTEDQARYVFGQVVNAVEYLDSLGIAHRDIKDENVVIDRNLKVRATFFFARVVQVSSRFFRSN